MITRWGANIEKDKVLLEYPRPQMRRNSYITSTECGSMQ